MYKLEDLKDRIRENDIAIVRLEDNTVFFKPKDYTLDSKLKSDLSNAVSTIGADNYALGDLLNGQVI